jgi:hypothetical protein
MTIEKIGTRYCIINSLGLIVKEFRSLSDAQKYLELQPA